MRLIDADELYFEKLQDTNGKAIPANEYIAFLKGAIAAEELVKNAPTIDVEPIVHCKDCIHWKQGELHIGNNGASFCECGWFSSYQNVSGGIYTSRDDYCSYGTKMDEGVNS